MTDKKSLSRQPASDRSLLIANLSILWILVFLFAYVWGGFIQQIESPRSLNTALKTAVFYIINFLPFILGSFGVSYAMFRKKFPKKGTIKSAVFFSFILVGAVLSWVVIASVNGIAYMVLN